MKRQKSENVRMVGGNSKNAPHGGTSLRSPGDMLTALPVARFEPRSLHTLVAEAAYYAAERRGFAPGAELDDWLLAERQVGGQAAEGSKS